MAICVLLVDAVLCLLALLAAERAMRVARRDATMAFNCGTPGRAVLAQAFERRPVVVYGSPDAIGLHLVHFAAS